MESLSTRSAKYRKLSCSVRLAGQVDWNFRFLVCGWATAAVAPASARANAASTDAACVLRMTCISSSDYDDFIGFEARAQRKRCASLPENGSGPAARP